MKKYKNVRAIKARKCTAYTEYRNEKYCTYYCMGIQEAFKNPTCDGYMCKCTEYKYDKKRGKFI